MVAGALKNPWRFPGALLRFGEDLWAAKDPAAEWTEHEIVPGDSPVFHRRFAGKDKADTPDVDEGEYLCVEEPLPNRSQEEGGPVEGIAGMAPDFGEVKPEFSPLKTYNSYKPTPGFSYLFVKRGY